MTNAAVDKWKDNEKKGIDAQFGNRIQCINRNETQKNPQVNAVHRL